jgi:protein-disulfide isomerase
MWGVPLTIVAVGALVAGFMLAQRSERRPAPVLPKAEPEVAGVRVEPGVISVVESDPRLGSETAPATIVVFTQLACTSCRHFFEATLPPMRRELLDSGKARLVLKLLPLGDDQQTVAEAALSARQGYCAQVAGRFWDVLEPMADAAVDDDCVASEAATEAVAATIRQAVAAGVTTVPTFVINNELYEGELSGSEIAQLLAYD